MTISRPELRYWNEAASAYSAREDNYADIYLPTLHDLIGDVTGKVVLDAGCGDGRHSQYLASQGAIVTAIDGSKNMLNHARSSLSTTGIKFLAADLRGRLPLPDRHFDMILCNMVLMDLPAIDTTLMELGRVLADGGDLVFCILHPAFFCAPWARDDNGRMSHKLIREYLSPQTRMLNFYGKTPHFHRPLTDYFEALYAAGLCVNQLREPQPTDELLKARPEWEYHRRIPSFMVVKAKHTV